MCILWPIISIKKTVLRDVVFENLTTTLFKALKWNIFFPVRLAARLLCLNRKDARQLKACADFTYGFAVT